VKYPANLGNQKRAKVLSLNKKTAGDWLKVKRLEKKLTLGRVAAKMGIATSFVCSWESSTRQPDSQQLKVLSSVLDSTWKFLSFSPAIHESDIAVLWLVSRPCLW
jgi:transcriptional regulator with XRE-family HTH domain